VPIQRHAVLIGMGKTGRRVLQNLPPEWNIYVIDKNINNLNLIPDEEKHRSITRLCEDATSRLVLKETNLQPASLVVVMTGSDEVNKEVILLARNEFQVEEILVIQNELDSDFPFKNIITLNAAELLANRLTNQMTGSLVATGVGLEQGEIQQVTVLNSSAAQGRSLKELNPQKWLVAAIYRNNKLIIPHGDTIIQTGDNVLVVGHPEILQSELDYLRGGQILFPTQYGNVVGTLELETIKNAVNMVIEKSNSESYQELQFANLNPNFHSKTEIRKHLLSQDIGLIIMPPKKVSWFARWGFTSSKIMTMMFSSQIPFLVVRESYTYKKILLAIGKQQAVSVLATVAMDLVRQFDAELTVLTVYPPNIDKTRYSELEAIPTEVDSIARSYGIAATKLYKEGNPITEIRRSAEEYDLVIIGYSSHTRSTLGNPDISLHLYHKTPVSVLFVPWQTAGR
jgi:Trk K+ transport system NAD-binding subunit/nucleotide-binding universal stress UspA family protein